MPLRTATAAAAALQGLANLARTPAGQGKRQRVAEASTSSSTRDNDARMDDMSHSDREEMEEETVLGP